MTGFSTIRDETLRAARSLAEAGVDSPQLDAEALMAYVIRSTRVRVIAHPEQELSDAEAETYRNAVARRVGREPLPYITGHREFWGLDFEVSSATLIPRPETETLVETAVAPLKDRENALLVDIGTGSGCVAAALAIELPRAVVYATEFSATAAEQARRNFAIHKLTNRVIALEGDMLSPLPDELRGKLDAIVSNPPYIPTAELGGLQPEVARYEPIVALDGGVDGMDAIRRILDISPEYLNEEGCAHLEIGQGQAAMVVEYARNIGYSHIRITKDLAGIERIVSCSPGS